MKRFYKVLMALIVVALSCQNLYAYDFSVENSDGKTIYYNKTSDSTVEVTYKTTSVLESSYFVYTGHVSIPSTVTYGGVTYTVTGIGAQAFYCKTGTASHTTYQSPSSVSIPNTVTYIGNNAFLNCSDLKSITIPSSVLKIGYTAFSGCTKLRKIISMPNTVPEGFGNAFDSMVARMTYVGNHNYDDYASVMGTVNIYSNLSSMFEDGGVKYVPVPTTRTVDAIDCDYTTVNITVPSEVTYSGVTLKVSNIKKNAFYNHNTMKQFVVGGEVAAIEDYAFSGCYALELLTFDSGETSLTLGSIDLSGSPIKTLNINRELSYTSSPFSSKTTLRTVNIGGLAKTVFAGEFSGCSNLNAVNVSGSVKEIQSYPFSSCSSLNILTVSGAVKEIKNSAFEGLPLTDITLDGDNLTIGADAFYGCSSLASVILNPGVGNIGARAFMNCSKIRSSINIGSINDVTIGDGAFSGCSAITSMTLGQGVTSIGANTFNGCKLITNFNLSEKITNIGAGAFRDCDEITSISLPSKVTEINDSLFYGCDKLATVTMSDNVTSIGASAFSNTPALTSIVLGNNVTTIGASAFSGASALTSVAMGNNVATIGANAFEGTSSLTEITLSSQLKTLGEYAFKSSAIKTIELPIGITSIANGTFQSSGLESFIIKDVVT